MCIRDRLGIVHSMAHKTGAAFSTGHIPHGCANAIYLPYVIKYNAKDSVAAKRYAEIARRMGLAGVSEKALINSLIEKIDAFNVELSIPTVSYTHLPSFRYCATVRRPDDLLCILWRHARRWHNWADQNLSLIHI